MAKVVGLKKEFISASGLSQIQQTLMIGLLNGRLYKEMSADCNGYTVTTLKAKYARPLFMRPGVPTSIVSKAFKGGVDIRINQQDLENFAALTPTMKDIALNVADGFKQAEIADSLKHTGLAMGGGNIAGHLKKARTLMNCPDNTSLAVVCRAANMYNRYIGEKFSRDSKFPNTNVELVVDSP